MSQLNYGYIRVYWNFCRPVELKKYIERGYQLTKNVGHYGCLTKKNSQLKLPAMARNTFNICRASQCKFTLWFVLTINWVFEAIV